MKTRMARHLICVALLPLFPLFAEWPEEYVSGFMVQKGINFVESDIYYRKEDILAVVGSFGISTNSMSFHEPFAGDGCSSCKRALTMDGRQITMEVFHAGTSVYAQKNMIRKLLLTSMPMELILKRYIQSKEFGDVLLYSTYDDIKGKTDKLDGAVVAFSRGNAAFILHAIGGEVSVLDFARNLDAKLVASDAISSDRQTASKKRKVFFETFLKIPAPLRDIIEPKFTDETLCEKLIAYCDGEIQFTDVRLYGESVLTTVRTDKDEWFLLQIWDATFWNSAIESIRNTVLAMELTEQEAARRIVTKDTISSQQIFLAMDLPKMWTFHNAGRFIAVLQPFSSCSDVEHDFFASMNRICEILDKFL